MTHQDDLMHFIQFFETLSRENTRSLTELYTSDAYFKDPFNEVRGHAAIIDIFEHMFKQVDEPKFVVTSYILQSDEAFIVWDFLFRKRNKSRTEQRIRGSSHLRFGPDHRVHYHRDYWDAAEELYEKIPLLGSLMRFLKNQARS
jgi:steroid delta-isomerase